MFPNIFFRERCFLNVTHSVAIVNNMCMDRELDPGFFIFLHVNPAIGYLKIIIIHISFFFKKRTLKQLFFIISKR